MELTIRMDWLTASGKFNKQFAETQPTAVIQYAVQARRIIGAFVVEEPQLKTIRAAQFYHQAFEDTRSGVQVHFGENLFEQGYMLVCSGKTCDHLKDIRGLSSSIEYLQMKVTRFDFAVDMVDGDFHPGDEYDAFLNEHGKDAAKKSVYTHSRRDHSFQLGSRSSERFFRFYDKGLEQRVKFNWKRLEIEYKDGYAQHAFDTYCDSPAKVAADIIKFIRVPSSPCTNVLQIVAMGEIAEKLKRPKVVADREKWLRNQVREAFQKLCIEDPSAAERVYIDFIDTYVAAGLWLALNLEVEKVAKNCDNSQE